MVSIGELRSDRHNADMVALVAPGPRALTPQHECYDLIAIGGGTAGLVSSSGAGILGTRVALIERNLLGGDCLVSGCVPSKALLHAARVAHDARHASAGISTTVKVDTAAVLERVRKIRAEIAHDDSIETLTERGVEVLGGDARFVGPRTLQVGTRVLRFKRALVATGATATVPPIPGLEEAMPLTHESLFELERLPARVVVIGGGPIGCEMAQAMARLGSTVMLVQRSDRLLPREDPDASALIEARLSAEGVDVRCAAEVDRVQTNGDTHVVHLGSERVPCDGIVVATGRRPNVDGLGLAQAGVEATAAGIVVDRFQRTSNRRVFAAGDVAIGPQFTHAAWAQAEFATLNAFFPARMDVLARPMPSVTYTDPEVARVGASAAEIERRGASITTLSLPWHSNDRAHTQDEHHGFARVHLDGNSDRIVAASAVGRGAGTIVSELSLAMSAGLGLRKVGRAIHPYPTHAGLWRDLAYAWQTQRVGPWTRRLARWWVGLLR